MNVGSRPGAGGDIPQQPGTKEGDVRGGADGKNVEGQQGGAPGQLPGQIPGQPQGAKGSAPQSGAKGTQGQQPTTGLRSTGGTSTTTSTDKTDGTKKPTVTFDGDSVDATAPQHGHDSADPLGEPPVPPPDVKLTGGEKHALADSTEALVGTLAELAKQGLTTEMLTQVLDRAAYLREHPDESFYAQMLGPDFAKEIESMFGNQLGGPLNAADAKYVQEHFGEFAVTLVNEYRGNATDFVANLLSGEGPLLGMTPEQFSLGINLMKEVGGDILEGIKAGEGTDALLRLQKHDFALPDSAIPKDASFTVPEGSRFPVIKGAFGRDGATAPEGKFASFIASVSEATFDAIINQCMALQAKDNNERLKQLRNDLGEMMKQQEGLRKAIIMKTNEIAGKEVGAAEQTGKAEKAAECQKIWGIIKAVVLVVVAIVVLVIACIGSPFSGGLSLALIAAVCAIVMLAVAVIQAIPALLQLLAMLLNACGFSEAAKAVDKAAQAVTDFLAQDWVKWTLFAITILCVVASLGVGIGGLVQGGAQAASATINIIKLISGVLGGVMQIGISVGMCMAQRDLIAAMKQLAELQGQLAKLQVKIAELVAEIEFLEKKQKTEQDRSKEQEELNQNIQKNLGKAVEIRNDMWNSVLTLGR